MSRLKVANLMHRRILFLVAGVLVLSLQSSFQPVLAALDFPNLTGRVVDNAKLLNNSQKNRLAKRLEQFEAATSNQVVVVTLPSLQGATIEEFGYRLGRHWGIGKAGRNNGVLLIVAPKERKVRIEVGSGLEGDLTDARAKAIIDHYILPVFRKGNYAAGIFSGVDKILAAIEGSYQPLSGLWKVLNSFLPGLILIVVFVVILVLYASGVGQREPVRTRQRDVLDEHDNPSRGYRSRRYRGGGFGGGGFSGGGGSFGGGGSSGSW